MSDTHEARRYVRSTRGPHPCPDSPVEAHNLIPDPTATVSRSLWVCPYDYEQERASKHRAAEEALAARMREARAEKIAADLIDTYAAEMLTEAERPEFLANAEPFRSMIADAALCGMTEKESAR